jgi:nucleoside-diphosphate-sugar epimerase
VEGIVRLMRRRYNLPVNLGNPSEFTILQLARLVTKLTGASTRIVYKPLPQDDPKQRRPNIALAKKLLKWQPKVALQEGLTRTISWFK